MINYSNKSPIQSNPTLRLGEEGWGDSIINNYYWCYIHQSLGWEILV